VEVVTLPHRDYRYRLTVPKRVWTDIVAQLAEEQIWSNFKDEVDRFQGAEGLEYVDALHETWALMRKLQHSGKVE
jgi:hypothetical protein